MELDVFFRSIPDSRRIQGRRYSLHSFLWMVFLSVCSGHSSSRTIAKFMKSHKKFFIKEFDLKHGVPSHVSVHTILKLTNKEEIKTSFNQYCSNQDLSKYDWLSGDGQILKSTLSDASTPQQDLISVVSLLVQKTGMVYLMEEYRSTKDSEIEVIQCMLSDLKDKGLIITLDAIHGQKKRLPKL